MEDFRAPARGSRVRVRPAGSSSSRPRRTRFRSGGYPDLFLILCQNKSSRICMRRQVAVVSGFLMA